MSSTVLLKESKDKHSLKFIKNRVGKRKKEELSMVLTAMKKAVAKKD